MREHKKVFLDFVRENLPSPVRVGVDEFGAACRRLGLNCSTDPDKGLWTIGPASGPIEEEMLVFEYQHPYPYYYMGKPPEVFVTYVAETEIKTPYGEEERKIRDFLSSNFAPAVRVPLPEPVVDMPPPNWVGAVGDDPRAHPVGQLMFLSEARRAFVGFNHRVATLLE